MITKATPPICGGVSAISGPAGTSYTTLELKVNYLRPVTTKTGTIYAEGKIIYVGGRIATAEGRLTDAEGKLNSWLH